MNKKDSRRSGTWLVVAVLLAILALSLVILYVGWGLADDVPGAGMSTAGYVAMTFGIIATLALGIGLMSLVFYSSRHGDDR
ncbi:hypothetical protein BH11PSE3_BH11PSE3_16720 [soil metagenome]